MNDLAEKQGTGLADRALSLPMHCKPMGGFVYCIDTSLCGTQRGQEGNVSIKKIVGCSLEFITPEELLKPFSMGAYIYYVIVGRGSWKR